jgi:hypothetical protein
MRKVLIAVAAVLVFVIIAVLLQSGRLHTNTSAAPLPLQVAKKLVAVRSAFAEEAAKSEQMRSDSEKFDRQLTETDSAVSESRNTFVPIVVSGLKIQNGLTHSLVDSNTAAYLQLELIADGIIARKGYTELDASLLNLENTFSDRDNDCKRLEQQEKVLSQVMESAKNESATDGEGRDIVSMLDSAVIAISMTTDQVIADYRNKVKPGTEALRGIVDKLPQR